MRDMMNRDVMVRGEHLVHDNPRFTMSRHTMSRSITSRHTMSRFIE